jgi:hypothetical protein
MLSISHNDITDRLNHVLNQLQSASARRERRRPGRPNQHIRGTYKRLDIYLPPDMVSDIDRIAATRETRTGCSAPRVDVIRDALAAYIRDHRLDTRV